MLKVTTNTISALSYVGLPNDSQRKRINKPLLKMIEYAINGVMNLQRPKHSYGVSYRYLLNQSIRQYLVPSGNIHISVGAMHEWQAMGLNPNDIYNYTYHDSVVPQKSIQVKTCAGTNKTPKTINVIAGTAIAYNSVFIDEHTTPVKDVIAALMKACGSQPNVSAIEAVLDKMHITKMLKAENAIIVKTTGRIGVCDYMNLSSSQIFNGIVSDPCMGYPKIY